MGASPDSSSPLPATKERNGGEVAFLFDLDQTLVDRDSAALAFVTEQYQRFSLPPTTLDACIARFQQLDHGGRADKRAVFETLATEFAIPVSGEKMAEDYRRNVGRFCKLFSGTAETLRELRVHGYKLGIVTNGSIEAQEAKITATGLNVLIDTVLISAREGLRKPDAAIFHRAVQRLNVQPENCIFVGDDPGLDILGAANVGMQTIWLPHSKSWPSELTPLPDYEITRLTDLLSIPFGHDTAGDNRP